MMVDYNVQEDLAANTILLIKSLFEGAHEAREQSVTVLASQVFPVSVMEKYKELKNKNSRELGAGSGEQQAATTMSANVDMRNTAGERTASAVTPMVAATGSTQI